MLHKLRVFWLYHGWYHLIHLYCFFFFGRINVNLNWFAIKIPPASYTIVVLHLDPVELYRPVLRLKVSYLLISACT